MEMKSSQPLELFYCYARKDRTLRDTLDRHLADLRHSGQITTWYDGEIIPGTPWEQEIETHLKNAHVILLLVSADFISSEYSYSKEMEYAIKRHNANEACVVPILLRPTVFTNAPFNHLQMLPSGALPVTRWTNRDEAWANVVQGIERVVDDLLSPNATILDMSPSLPSHDESFLSALDKLQREEQISMGRESPGKVLSDDDFLKWLKKTALRPIAYRRHISQGIGHIREIKHVTPFDAKQFPGTNITPGESIKCELLVDGSVYMCFANDRAATYICEVFDWARLVKVTVECECLGLLKEYPDYISPTYFKNDEGEDVAAEYHSAYLIKSVEKVQ